MVSFDIGSFRYDISCSQVARCHDWSRRRKAFIPKRPFLLLLTAGRRAFRVDDCDYVAETGDLVCFAKDQPYYNEQSKNVTWRGYRLRYRLQKNIRSPEIVDLPPVIRHLSPENRDLIHALAIESRGQSIFARRRARAYLELLLTDLAGLTHRNSIVAHLERVIGEDPVVNISLEELAETCGMSTATVKRHLKNECGQTFSQFRRGIKVALARQLLEFHPDRSLAEIAEALGYYDVFHFSRSFKAVTGLPPGAYRKRHAVRAAIE